jgi:hypothetical protein
MKNPSSLTKFLWLLLITTVSILFFPVLGKAGSISIFQEKQTNSQIILERQGSLVNGDSVLPSDGSLYDVYQFSGQVGERVIISLSSSDFDTYLAVLDPNGTVLEENDDISSRNLNSQIVLTLPSNGTYTVVVNAYDSTGRGRYQLIVSSAEDSGRNVAREEVLPVAQGSLEGFGTISGQLSFPSDILPAMTICAQSTSNYYLLNCIESEDEQRTFQMDVRPGEYFVFSYISESSGESITQYHANWGNNSQPIPVRVNAGGTFTNVNPQNYVLCRERPYPSYCVRPPQ